MKTTTGTITATGTAGAFTHALDLAGPDCEALVAVGGTFTSCTFAVDGKPIGGSLWQPLSIVNRKTALRYSGQEAATNSTNTAWEVDVRGMQSIRVYDNAAGTPTSVTVEVVSGTRKDFGDAVPLVQTVSTGASVLGATTFSGAASPATDDGAALGAAAARWSDLFLAEGGVINFDNGDITITQTSGVLAIAGTTSTTFDGPVNPATNDAGALGTTSLGWSDLHLATGGVINFANGEVTITETDANTLTVAGTTLIAFGATTLNVTGTRIVTSYHTNLVSTNAVTVDSSETVKRDISPYNGDALAVLDKVRVATFRHNDHLDSGDLKLGMIAESLSEPLALDQIERDGGGRYPGVNLYALASLQTRAIQQLSDKYKNLEEKLSPR